MNSIKEKKLIDEKIEFLLQYAQWLDERIRTNMVLIDKQSQVIENLVDKLVERFKNE